jgi:hypothetical protein
MAAEETVACDSIERAAKELITSEPHLRAEALIKQLAAEGFNMQPDAALAAVASAAGVPVADNPDWLADDNGRAGLGGASCKRANAKWPRYE